jgi:ATP-dependent DNA helicase, RecQ family
MNLLSGEMTKHDLLKKYFGHDEFREGQAEIINSIICGRDSLAIMPTGAGKSVCYQIPALMFDGITIVISPLISLMKDQVGSIQQSGIPAAFINSSLSHYEYNETLQDAVDNKFKIIYVAPERLSTESFIRFANIAKISMIAVDEAHCVSQWGQDFRPSYIKITDFIEKLSYRPVISAFTATATTEVRDDIISILKLVNPFLITTGFDRRNLYFEVRRPKSKFPELCNILMKHENNSGIIYCLTRKNVEEVCENLNAAGYNATRYHAGLNDYERMKNQDDFIYDRKTIMVATNAFGMGIDKSNVSFVIHYSMPKNLENYYQEAGRAGRDGEKADCILLYNGQDVHTNQYLIENSLPNPVISPFERDEIKQRDRDRLKQITYYCNIQTCLRSFILKYFGENAPPRCGYCSNCSPTSTVKTTFEDIPQFKERNIDNDLLLLLKRLRKEIADKEKVPADNILTDASLHDMCDKLPRSLADMSTISGVGSVKLKNYGQKFINVIRKYTDEISITSVYETTFMDHGKVWTDIEDAQLIEEYNKGVHPKEIARVHKRPVDEITSRIDELDLEWSF